MGVEHHKFRPDAELHCTLLEEFYHFYSCHFDGRYTDYSKA
jgi:hypothetical protein